MKNLHLWFKWFKLGMQRHSKALGWNMIESLHPIRWCNINILAFLCNTMIKKWFMVGKFPTMPYSILFKFQVLTFMCNIYGIVLFVLKFETPFERCLWLMLWMQHWPITRYLHDDMPMIQRLHQHITRGPIGSHLLLVVT
jgi:hypothetical protein